MPQEFNLIDEEWLPCLMSSGERKSMSLRKVFAEAHEVQELLDASPLVTISLHRLLLAILHRALMGPVNMEAWKDLWEARQLEMTKLNAYFEKHRPRFFLFDDESKLPFFQVPRMQKVVVKKRKKRNEPEQEERVTTDLKIHPVQKLAQELASGDNKAWFDHHQNEQPASFSEAEAARYLVTTQAFALGGGISEDSPNFTDAPLARDLVVLVRGKNLFETLLLNFVEYRDSAPFKLSSGVKLQADKPAWEQAATSTTRKASPQGYADYLTWQTRAIHLIRTPEGFKCQVRQNLELDFEEPWDPFKCYQINDGYIAVRIRPERATWRDCHTLFQKATPNSNKVKRPSVFDLLAQVEDLRSEEKIQADLEYRFDIFGLSPKKADPLFWRHERLPLPVNYLESLTLWGRLEASINLTEFVERTLRENTRLLAVFTLISNWHLLHPNWPALIRKWDEQKKAEDSLKRHKDISNIAKSFQHGNRYWSQIGVMFPRLLKELAEDYDPATEAYGKHKLPEWADNVRTATRDTFRQVAAGIEGSDRGLRAVSLVEQNFEARLNIVIKKFKDDLH